MSSEKKKTTTNEQRLVSKRAGRLDQADVDEVVWDGNGPPPSDTKGLARVLDWLLDPDDLVQDELGDWLAHVGLKSLNMAAVRAALEVKVAPMVKRALATARKQYAQEQEEVQELSEVGWVGGREVPRDLADETTVLSALRRLEATTPGALHSIGKTVRPLCAMSHDAFDRALLSLAKQRKAVLHHTDLPSALTPEERAGALEHDGFTFIGAALAS